MKSCRALHGSMVLGALGALGLVLAAVPAQAATLATEAAAAFDVENDFMPGVNDATDVAVLPDGRVVIIERTGGVLIKTPGVEELAQSSVTVNSGHGEQGLLGVVADPGFATNQYLYFYASAGADAANRHQIQRYKLGANGMLTDKKIVVEMGLKGPANHNGGALDIYQGNLYIGVGDTGANNTPPTNRFSSCLNIANGKVLRVSLAEATLGQPVADNPLMAEAMVTGCDSTGGDFALRAPEKRIFAWGFRNPFRLWVDPTNGNVWVGDVGEGSFEEVGIVRKGSHAGYPFREGKKPYDEEFHPEGACMGMTPATPCVEPLYDWVTNPDGGGGTAIGGRILDGCDWPAAWKSRYIFGDHEQGKVWTLGVNGSRDGMVAGSVKEFASTDSIRALRIGTDNALYMVEANNIARVTAKGATATPNSCEAVNRPIDPGGGGSGGGAAGGSGNTAGTGNPAGGNAAGGSMSTAGGPSTAGNGNMAGTSPTGGSGGSDEDSGCGCQVIGARTTSVLGLGVLGAALGLALGRRRRRVPSVKK
jgi:glucose/arabinose dehydrogenase